MGSARNPRGFYCARKLWPVLSGLEKRILPDTEVADCGGILPATELNNDNAFALRGRPFIKHINLGIATVNLPAQI